ncbi:MAG: hypothetical protein HXY40_12730 [Chloroflexi bacterium]|nr:hypothetical protein [Chloroflexota bacterium]
MLEDDAIRRIMERLQADDHSAIWFLGKELTLKVLSGRKFSPAELATFAFGIQQICAELAIELSEKESQDVMGIVHYRLAQFWKDSIP